MICKCGEAIEYINNDLFHCTKCGNIAVIKLMEDEIIKCVNITIETIYNINNELYWKQINDSEEPYLISLDKLFVNGTNDEIYKNLYNKYTAWHESPDINLMEVIENTHIECDNCKNKILPKYWKYIDSGREYCNTVFGETEAGVTYIQCPICENIQSSSELYYYFLSNSTNIEKEEDSIWNYLTQTEKDQLKGYTLSNENKESDTFFDDYTAWVYTANIMKDNDCVGIISVTCGRKNNFLGLANNPEYEYTTIITMSDENTDKTFPKFKTPSFNEPKCLKCGESKLFCDCNLKCEICGKVFCEHKYKF